MAAASAQAEAILNTDVVLERAERAAQGVPTASTIQIILSEIRETCKEINKERAAKDEEKMAKEASQRMLNEITDDALESEAHIHIREDSTLASVAVNDDMEILREFYAKIRRVRSEEAYQRDMDQLGELLDERGQVQRHHEDVVRAMQAEINFQRQRTAIHRNRVRQLVTQRNAADAQLNDALRKASWTAGLADAMTPANAEEVLNQARAAIGAAINELQTINNEIIFPFQPILPEDDDNREDLKAVATRVQNTNFLDFPTLINGFNETVVTVQASIRNLNQRVIDGQDLSAASEAEIPKSKKEATGGQPGQGTADYDPNPSLNKARGVIHRDNEIGRLNKQIEGPQIDLDVVRTTPSAEEVESAQHNKKLGILVADERNELAAAKDKAQDLVKELPKEGFRRINNSGETEDELDAKMTELKEELEELKAEREVMLAERKKDQLNFTKQLADAQDKRRGHIGNVVKVTDQPLSEKERCRKERERFEAKITGLERGDAGKHRDGTEQNKTLTNLENLARDKATATRNKQDDLQRKLDQAEADLMAAIAERDTAVSRVRGQFPTYDNLQGQLREAHNDVARLITTNHNQENEIARLNPRFTEPNQERGNWTVRYGLAAASGPDTPDNPSPRRPLGGEYDGLTLGGDDIGGDDSGGDDPRVDADVKEKVDEEDEGYKKQIRELQRQIRRLEGSNEQQEGEISALREGGGDNLNAVIDVLKNRIAESEQQLDDCHNETWQERRKRVNREAREEAEAATAARGHRGAKRKRDPRDPALKQQEDWLNGQWGGARFETPSGRRGARSPSGGNGSKESKK